METTILYEDYIGDIYWGHIRIMENKMETTIVYWGYIGIMEKTSEITTLFRVLGFRAGNEGVQKNMEARVSIGSSCV